MKLPQVVAVLLFAAFSVNAKAQFPLPSGPFTMATMLDFSEPGTYAVPTPNCGFTVTGPNGWLRLSLLNDSGTTDLYARAGESYPLEVKQLTIPAARGTSIVVNVTASCTCSVILDPFATAGLCYTRSLGADECEVDPSRPGIADSAAVPPGPNLGLVDVGFFGSGEGDVDYLSWLQGDDGEYWQTARLRAGQWNLGGARRCRLVDGSANSYLTLIAP